MAVIFALAILAGFGENIFGDFLGILRNFIFTALIMVKVSQCDMYSKTQNLKRNLRWEKTRIEKFLLI